MKETGMITVSCPKCSNETEVLSSQAGTVANCPTCGEPFKVPDRILLEKERRKSSGVSFPEVFLSIVAAFGIAVGLALVIFGILTYGSIRDAGLLLIGFSSIVSGALLGGISKALEYLRRMTFAAEGQAERSD
jgi:hypothetical protein